MMNLKPLTVAALVAATATAAQQPFDLEVGFRTQFQKTAIGDILERSDGTIIISGRVVPPGGDPTSPRGGGLLEPNGTWIPKPTDRPIVDWYFYMGGKMVAWGDRFYVSVGQGIVRYWMDGTWDSAFPVYDPKNSGGQGGDFHVFPDGRLLIAGNYWLKDTVRGFVGWQYGLVWLNTDGSLDTTRIHRSIGGNFGAFEHIREMPDGKFMLSGGSGQFEGVPVEGMFRVNSDGSLDTTFQVPAIDGWVESYGFLPQPGGKVLAYGRWHFAGMPSWVGLARFLPNGQLDPSFNNQLAFAVSYGSSPAPTVRHVEPIGTGLLAITGAFDRINGEVHGGIAMIDTAGNLRPGYFEGSGCGGYLEGVSMPTRRQAILGIKPANDGGYFIYGMYHGYDDGTGTNGSNQRLMSKLYGLNVGINEQQPSPVQALQIAPNPSAGSTVFSTGAALGNAELVVHDASGRAVWQEPWPAGTYTHTLRAGLLAPGTYMVRVASNASTLYTGKLIVLP